MRSFLLSAALTIVSAAPAVAGDFYGQLHGGVVFSPEYDFTITAPGLDPDSVEGAFGTDAGFAAGGAIGKFLTENIRAEAEVTYRQVGIDSIMVDDFVISVGDGGGLSSIALMGNGYFDFNFGGPITPYVGAGVGAAFIGGELNDTVFAYQGIAGLSLPVSERSAVGAEYRYFGAGDPTFVDPGITLSMDYSASSVMGFWRVKF